MLAVRQPEPLLKLVSFHLSVKSFEQTCDLGGNLGARGGPPSVNRIPVNQGDTVDQAWVSPLSKPSLKTAGTAVSKQ